MHDAYAHCEALVREADKDRFLASLFAPAERREDLFALYAFNVEIARIRDLAREPMPGEIRLQWWRDALCGQGQGEAAAHPIAGALIETIGSCALPIDRLIALIDARSFDLYDDPMVTTGDLEAYAQATSSSVFALAARVLGGEGEAVASAANAGGIAYALANLLRAFPRHASRGQLYLPGDLLERHAAVTADILAGRTSPALVAVLAELRAMAVARLDECRKVLSEVPPQAAPAFLPLALVRPLLDRLARNAAEPFTPVEVPQWRRQWVLWRASGRHTALD